MRISDWSSDVCSSDLNNLGAITLNADYYWSDDLIYTTTRLPSYDVVNARLEWSDVAGRPIDLSVFAKNLFDKEYLSTGGVAGVGMGWVSAVYGAPRMYGLGLRVRFGDCTTRPEQYSINYK